MSPSFRKFSFVEKVLTKCVTDAIHCIFFFISLLVFLAVEFVISPFYDFYIYVEFAILSFFSLFY